MKEFPMYLATVKDSLLTPNRPRLAAWQQLLLALTLGLGLFVIVLATLAAPNVWAAGFTVTKTADTRDGTCDGDCSLREAISAANASGAGDITLPAGVYTLTRTGAGENANATGDLDITAATALTITGAGAEQTIINANGIDRVFDLRPGAGTVVISGVTIYNGASDGSGGGINNQDAALTLINTRVVSNAAAVDTYGGGLYIETGSATLTDTQVLSNSAYSGGGLFVDQANATLKMSGGEVNYNTADALGGGLYIETGSAVLTGTQMLGNVSNSEGGGLYVNAGNATLTDTQVLSNETNTGGGGLLVYDSGATLKMTGGAINSNVARYGGGLYVSSGSATLAETQVYSNTATNGDGGGLYIETGSATLTDTQVYSNAATIGDGGGLYVGYVYEYVGYDSATLSMTGGEVTNNTAGNTGGGLYVGYGSATLTGTQVLSNTANSDGGGLYVGQSSGAITATNGCIVNNSDTSVRWNGITLDASDTWWGAANGPDGAGPGSGDTVNAGVNYANFKTVAPAGCPTLSTAAEIYVLGQGQIIPGGSTSPTSVNDTDFSPALVGVRPVTHTFTISNSGAAALNLSGASLDYSTAFSLIQPASPVNSGSGSPLTVTFNPTVTGQFSDTVRISSNDPNESSYTFVISGTGIAGDYDLAVNQSATVALAGSAADNTTTITYTISVHNASATLDAGGVVISDTLPVSVTLVTSHTTNSSSYNHTTGQWAVGPVTSGSSVTMTLVVTGHNLVNQQITNQAELVQSSPTDVITDNNSAVAIVQPGLYYYLPAIVKN